MYHLLAICLVLHPQCIDESIHQVLREKNYHEKMYKMQYGELNVCFKLYIPIFIYLLCFYLCFEENYVLVCVLVNAK
jgi:translation initiation factor 3 subunit L